jgi:hypothetical protein
VKLTLRGRLWLGLTTLAIAGTLAAAKAAIAASCTSGTCLEVIHPSDAYRSLLSSVLGGGVFVLGLVVAGTLTDYKESERFPAELASALESVHVEARAFARKVPSFDLDTHKGQLLAVLTGFQDDVRTVGMRRCLTALAVLSDAVGSMEDLGLPTTHASRLKNEIASTRKGVLRIYHVQETSFAPSATVLLSTVVALILGLLVLTPIGHGGEAAVIVGAIAYVFIYLVRLARTLDRPFRADRAVAVDDVDHLLLRQLERRLTAEE